MNQNVSILIAATAGFIFGGLFCGGIVRNIYQQKIIEQGVGEWQVNPLTGEKKFVIFDRKSLAK